MEEGHITYLHEIYLPVYKRCAYVSCVCVHNKSALLYQFNERRWTSIDSPDRAPTRQAPSTCNVAEEPVHSRL